MPVTRIQHPSSLPHNASASSSILTELSNDSYKFSFLIVKQKVMDNCGSYRGCQDKTRNLFLLWYWDNLQVWIRHRIFDVIKIQWSHHHDLCLLKRSICSNKSRVACLQCSQSGLNSMMIVGFFFEVILGKFVLSGAIRCQKQVSRGISYK